jgi:hypothetical protein
MINCKLKGERKKMKTKLMEILTVLSIILMLTLPVLYVSPGFAANVTLPFKDGFESGDFSKWSVLAGGSVTSGDAHHGTYKAVFSSGYIQARFTAVDHCFMRAYVMFKAFPASGIDTSIFGVYKVGGYYMAEAMVRNVTGTIKWELRYYDNGGSLKAISELEKPVLDTWYCV